MEDRFYNLALRFLSYRPRSEKEIREKLKSKSSFAKASEGQGKFILEVIDKVIQKLKEKKFINDEEFARMFVGNRLRFRPRSLRLIKLELKQKGISPEIISNSILSEAEGLISNDEDSAKMLVEKRIGRFKGLDKQKIYEKLGRFLASKGFSWDTIKKAIDEVLGKGV